MAETKLPAAPPLLPAPQRASVPEAEAVRAARERQLDKRRLT
jgi:hypothetical protein